MTMIWVAVGTAAAGLITQGVSSKVAKDKRKKADTATKKRVAGQKKDIDAGVKDKQLAQMDVARELEGQSNIDPNAAFIRDDNDRATATMLSRIERAGGSAIEKMNLSNAAIAQGQRRGQKVAADTSERRGKLRVMSKQQKAEAAQTGLEGKQAMIALDDKGRQQSLQEQQLINQSVGQTADAISGMFNDMGSIYMYTQSMGSGKTPPAGWQAGGRS